MKNKPNILFIMTDQQSSTMLGCAGNPYVHTPAIDWLASTGVKFNQAYCTNPVCIPSRFSLMTGRYPSAIGVRQNNLSGMDCDSGAKCFSQGLGWLLQDAGYETVYAGKQHLPNAVAEDLGFTVLTTDERDELAEVCSGYVQQKHDKPFALVASFINPHDICHMAILDDRYSGRRSDLEKPFPDGIHKTNEYLCLDDALSLPEGISEEDFFESHCPPLPANHKPQEDEPDGVSELLDERPFRKNARENYSSERWRMHRWAYARLAERVDRQIGILLDAMKISERERDTLIVFTSDHGDHDSAHQLEHKTIPYQEATRIPLIIRPVGGLAKGRKDSHLVSNGLDLVPTLCAYAGAAIPEDLPGCSLKPLVEGKTPAEWRDHICIESQNSFSVNTGDWQYTRFDSGINDEQLYDLRSDPGQTRNHALLEKNRDILACHRRLFEQNTDGLRILMQDECI